MAKKGRGPKGEGALRLLATLGGATALSLSTCGIQTEITYFPAPSLSVINQYFSFQLSHTTSNTDPSLEGYEIYYRAYDTQAAADAAVQNVDNLAAQTTSQTPLTVLSTLTSSGGTNPGFVRMFSYYNGMATDGSIENGTRPMFYVDTSEVTTGTPVNYIINMDSGSGPSAGITATHTWYYLRSTDSTKTKVPVLRYSPVNNIKNFEDNFTSSDLDYAYTGSGSFTTFFVFFAIAYGMNLATFTTVYSFPTPAIECQYS